MIKINEGLSFDDVLIAPGFSDVLPTGVNLSTVLVGDINLNVPVLSAAMDKVTDHVMAIAMAQAGGLGVIHRNFSKDAQLNEVRLVKSVKGNSDVACVDSRGFLRAGAAIGTSDDFLNHAESLITSGVDVLVLDTAHGHSSRVIEVFKKIKERFPTQLIIVGNIATADAARSLAEIGVDAVKVGIGPGSICTTRVMSGVGVPQFTAIAEVVDALSSSSAKKIPVIADGGIKNSGDIAKAIAAGADSVMIGSLFAGTDEAPGEKFEKDGKFYKKYRGMGSIAAMKSGSSDRYFQKQDAKLVAEGVEGAVPYKGAVNDVLFQLMGGLRASMGYTGNKNIDNMRRNCSFVRMTASGLRESRVHDVIFLADAPND